MFNSHGNSQERHHQRVPERSRYHEKGMEMKLQKEIVEREKATMVRPGMMGLVSCKFKFNKRESGEETGEKESRERKL